jgi:hypothetical protein
MRHFLDRLAVLVWVHGPQGGKPGRLFIPVVFFVMLGTLIVAMVAMVLIFLAHQELAGDGQR